MPHISESIPLSGNISTAPRHAERSVIESHELELHIHRFDWLFGYVTSLFQLHKFHSVER
jgi:hypothetical protein